MRRTPTTSERLHNNTRLATLRLRMTYYQSAVGYLSQIEGMCHSTNAGNQEHIHYCLANLHGLLHGLNSMATDYENTLTEVVAAIKKTDPATALPKSALWDVLGSAQHQPW